MNMNVEGKRVLVCGMARSGIAAAKLLISLGARVTITDTKPEGEFGGALDELRTPECTFALGQSADGLIAGQDIMVISPGIAWAKPFVQNAIAHRHERQDDDHDAGRRAVSRDGTHDARRRKHRLSDYRDGGHIQTG